MEINHQKRDKQKIVIIVLMFLLILAVGYIAFDKFKERKLQEQMGIYQQGAQYGYEQAIIQVVQQAVTCNEVPLRVENETVNMIAVDCLKSK